MSATLLSSPCKRTTGRPSPPPRRSLHALCKECDGFVLPLTAGNTGFNPRTPCGVRPSNGCRPAFTRLFQSTHSLRSATSQRGIILLPHLVSIHALLAECDCSDIYVCVIQHGFNPRTPCGVRLGGRGRRRGRRGFNPRTPCGVRPMEQAKDEEVIRRVSIHALLAECDRLMLPGLANLSCFNPRTPCGVRPWTPCTVTGSTRFQSTHSLRSATVFFRLCLTPFRFQSTHSLRSATPSFHIRLNLLICFNPRTPCGVRLSLPQYQLQPPEKFQSTHSLRSATGQGVVGHCQGPVSIHALLAECDRDILCKAESCNRFQSTHSLRSATERHDY